MQNEIDIVAFENDILQFNILEEQIKVLKKKLEPLQKCLKQLKKEKTIVQNELCEIMNKHGISACNLPKDENGEIPATVKFKETTVVVPLTRELMKNILIDFFIEDTRKFDSLKPSDKGLFLYNYMISCENRPTMIKQTVRKVKYVDEDIDITENFVVDEGGVLE